MAAKRVAVEPEPVVALPEAPVDIGNCVGVFSSNRFTEPAPTRVVAGHLECRDSHDQHTNLCTRRGWLASVASAIGRVSDVLERLPVAVAGFASLADAASQGTSAGKVVSTDPPYYDNICYADLSDFFYVWLR